MAPRLKTYQLYTDNFGCPIYNRTADYRHSMMVVTVAAHSIRQAYYLCSKEVWKTDMGEPGITRVQTNTSDINWKERRDGPNT